MSLFADLLASVQGEPVLYVVDAVAGPRFTALAAGLSPQAVEPMAAGVAYTGAGEIQPGFDSARATADLRSLVCARPLLEVAPAIVPDGSSGGFTDFGQPSAGLRSDAGAAALNAMLAAQVQRRGVALQDENGLDLIGRLGAGKRLAIVGRFPYLSTIRLNAAESWVLELTPEADEVPAAAAPEILPRADVVGITGSTLANGTLEGLLLLCRRDAFVALIGPTTPLSPILFDYGVDVLCGAMVEDAGHVLASLAADVSTRRLPGMRPVSLRPQAVDGLHPI